jgi:hypothetical protein
MATGAIQAERFFGKTVEVVTKPCIMCSKTHTFSLPADAYVRWQRGAFIQDCFPELPAGDRETLISGTCNDCFNKLFPAED